MLTFERILDLKMNDRRSECNLCNCVKKPEKNSGLQRGLNPWPNDTSAMLYQLSYEATDVGSRSIVGSYVPVKEMSVNDIWNKSYMNSGNEMKMKKLSSQWTQLMQLRKEASFLSREHMNPQLTCFQRQWLHSSVSRASHRYREVTGSNPVVVLNTFQASLRKA